ncbi:MAG: flavodoxin family protein [Clostridiales bacterium]|nr:flavodoxin family protein [Clostridiales bacterium]
MNIIIVNGSPKRGGQCEKLIKMFNEGINAEIIDVFFENISPCTDCGGCRDSGKCVIEDDMTKHYGEIAEMDIIVFASPLYFSSLTGIMMNFLSRFQVFFYNGELIKKEKRAILLLTGGGTTKKTDISERQLKIALTAIKGKLMDTIAFTETDRKSVEESQGTKEKIDRVKAKLIYNKIS